MQPHQLHPDIASSSKHGGGGGHIAILIASVKQAAVVELLKMLSH
jgi:hypothetical protein